MEKLSKDTYLERDDGNQTNRIKITVTVTVIEEKMLILKNKVIE